MSEIIRGKISVKSDAELKYNRQKEESMDTNLSEASTLDLDDGAESEKLNLAAKRKHGVSPLLVSNFPEDYSFQKITEYLVELCGPCEVSIAKNDGNDRVIEVGFRSKSEQNDAKKILNSKTINGKKITVSSLPDNESDSESEHEGPEAKRKKEREGTPWGLDFDVWQTDPKGYYGVKPQYLDSLGIIGSLQNWVLVLNFRCGREELKEVMELAGDVVVCSVQYHTASNRYANVMFRHPLEALQAVSMFNGQMLYGRPLTVKMLKGNNCILPKGLNNVGPGLAKYGKPLRDVVRHYERFIKGQEHSLNSNVFMTPQEQCSIDKVVYSEDDDTNERRAREALETLVNLVEQGVKVEDLLKELKSIQNDNKSNIDQILKELSSTVEANNDEGDLAPPGTKELTKDDNKNDRSGSISSKSSVKSAASSPDPAKNPQTSNSSQTISIVSSSRTTEINSWAKTNQARPVTPASNQTGFGGPRPMGPGCGPMPRPMPGPRPVPRPMAGPTGPIGPMMGNMAGPRPSMPGPRPSMPGPISGPVRGPMPVPNPNGPMPMQGPTMFGPNPGPTGPMARPAGPMAGPMSGPSFMMPGPNTHPPLGPNVQRTLGPEALVQFSNLPLSTTFALLSDKLSQVGQLISLQFTTPGCVVVKFAHRAQAERCIQQFNQSRLEGNLITVKIL